MTAALAIEQLLNGLQLGVMLFLMAAGFKNSRTQGEASTESAA